MIQTSLKYSTGDVPHDDNDDQQLQQHRPPTATTAADKNTSSFYYSSATLHSGHENLGVQELATK